MDPKGFSGGQFRPLSEGQVETIHEAALTVLEETGFTYEPGLAETVKILGKAGAKVDPGSARIFFPRDMVLEQVGKAPDKFVLYSRDKKDDLDLGEDRVYLGTGGAALKVLDLETGHPRPSTLMDLYHFGQLVDQLENVHFFLRPCVPTDIPESLRDVNIAYSCFQSTSKHVMVGVNDESGLLQVLDLASKVAGSMERLQEKPFLSIVSCFAVSPLRFCTIPLRIAQEACRHRIPVALSTAPLAGSTSPITLAGTLALVHAEELAGITVCQLTNPGAPVLYGALPETANLYTMGFQGGSVESAMMNAATHQMARRIRVPNYANSGHSDSKVPDAQAAWETAMSTVLASMGGCNYIHHAAGMLESSMTVSFEHFVMNDEIIGRALRILKGIEVDPEHLALEVIREVGPGGNFMTSPHTLAHLRTEFFPGNGVTDAHSRAKWESGGSLDARDRGRQIAKSLIGRAKKFHLPEEADKAIRNKYQVFLEPAAPQK
jgi:trimethylamine--corrinoid protein Co-methyltransferase